MIIFGRLTAITGKCFLLLLLLLIIILNIGNSNALQGLFIYGLI